MMTYSESFELGEIMAKTAKSLGIYKMLPTKFKKKVHRNRIGFCVGWNFDENMKQMRGT